MIMIQEREYDLWIYGVIAHRGTIPHSLGNHLLPY